MIKTIQYLTEADNSRVLVALDLKTAFQNVSSKWYCGTMEHRMHFDSVCTKINANSGVDQGCPLPTCGFSAVVDPALGHYWWSFAHMSIQALNFLPT